MNPRRLLLSACLAVTLAACGGPRAYTRGTYEDPNTIEMLSDRFNENDLQLIAKKMASEVDRLKSVLAPRKGPPPVPSELNTACPACTSPMKEVPVGKLHVDYCSQCKGIFLDRGELDAALELVKGAGGTMLSLIAAAISEAPIDIDVG